MPLPAPKRILIIKLRHHGDVLLSTPVADALHHACPGIETDMLVYAETAPVLRHNRQIRHIFTIDRQWKKQGLRAQIGHERQLLAELKAQHYDWVLNLSDQWRAGVIARLCGRHSIGYAYRRRDNALWRLLHEYRVNEPGDAHITGYHLAALAPLGLPDGYAARVRLEIGADARESLHAKLREQGWQGESYVLAHPGSRWLFKCWEDGKTAELLQKLLDAGKNIVLTAAPDPHEADIVRRITGSLKTGKARLWTLSGCLSLRELAAAIEGAELFIGVDSVPMHMAAALDKPQVALFGPSHVHRWRPYSDRATVVWAGDYGTLPHPDSIDTNDPTRLLSAIPVDAVWHEAAKKLGITDSTESTEGKTKTQHDKQ